MTNRILLYAHADENTIQFRTICWFFGDTCIKVREVTDGGRVRLEPVAGDQAACGEWTELPIDRVYGYCTLLERHINGR